MAEFQLLLEVGVAGILAEIGLSPTGKIPLPVTAASFLLRRRARAGAFQCRCVWAASAWAWACTRGLLPVWVSVNGFSPSCRLALALGMCLVSLGKASLGYLGSHHNPVVPF